MLKFIRNKWIDNAISLLAYTNYMDIALLYSIPFPYYLLYNRHKCLSKFLPNFTCNEYKKFIAINYETVYVKFVPSRWTYYYSPITKEAAEQFLISLKYD